MRWTREKGGGQYLCVLCVVSPQYYTLLYAPKAIGIWCFTLGHIWGSERRSIFVSTPSTCGACRDYYLIFFARRVQPSLWVGKVFQSNIIVFEVVKEIDGYIAFHPRCTVTRSVFFFLIPCATEGGKRLIPLHNKVVRNCGLRERGMAGPLLAIYIKTI